MLDCIAEYTRKRPYALSKDTRRSLLSTYKHKLQIGHVSSLPGLFAVHGFPGHAVGFIAALLLEALGIFAIVIFLGAGAVTGAVLLLLDALFVVGHASQDKHVCEAANRARAESNQGKKVQYQRTLRTRRFVRSTFGVILIILGLGKAFFFHLGASASGEIAPAIVWALIACYIAVAICHIYCTGSFFHALRAELHFRRDRRAWHNADEKGDTAGIVAVRNHKHFEPKSNESPVEMSIVNACGVKKDEKDRWMIWCYGILFDDDLQALSSNQPSSVQQAVLEAGHSLQIEAL